MTLRPGLLLVFCLAFGLLGAPGASAQEEPPEAVELEGVSISAPLLSLARPDEWTPVHVEIDLPVALEARLEIGFDEDLGNKVVRELDLPAHSRRRIVIPVRAPALADELRVQVVKGRSSVLAYQSFELSPRAADPDGLRVLVVGEDPLGFTLLREVMPLPVVGHPTWADEAYRPVAVETLIATQLPDTWFAYSSVDLILWPDPNPSVLQTEQQLALRGWVAAGGTLAVGLGPSYASWASSPLGRITPGSIRGATTSRSALDEVLAIGGGASAGSDPEAVLPLVQIVPSAEAMIDLQDAEGGPLVLSAPRGAGRLVVMAFDPGAGELRTTLNRERFWRALFGLWRPPTEEEISVGGELSEIVPVAEALEHPRLRDGLRYLQAPPVVDLLDSQASPCVHSPSALTDRAALNDVHLASLGVVGEAEGWWGEVGTVVESFEGAIPLSLSFILLFGLAYLLAIGPLDFLILRKLKRPMLTWFTFPCLAIGFALLAAGVIKAKKAGSSEIRCLLVEDVFPGLGVTRGSQWCGVWSSSRQVLDIGVARGSGFLRPDPALDYSEHEAWAFYGVDQSHSTGIRGTDLEFRSRPGRVGMSYEASQWTSSRVAGTWITEGGGRVDWLPSAEGGSLTEVVNRTGRALRDAWIVDGTELHRVGTLERDGRATVDRSPDLFEQGPVFGETNARLWKVGIEAIEQGEGHLHLAAEPRPFLVAFPRDSADAQVISGFRDEVQVDSLVRIPLIRPPEQEESP